MEVQRHRQRVRETVLGPKGFGGVQITPPAEHKQGQPGLVDRLSTGQLQELQQLRRQRGTAQSMIARCNAARVKVYADAVFNQLASGTGTATGGSSYNSGRYQYPQFGYNDFHHSGDITNYGDSNNVWNGALYGMPDLNTGSSYVQDQIATYMKTLLGWGVAGFRIDAAKHMAPADVKAILDKAGSPRGLPRVIGAGGESPTSSRAATPISTPSPTSNTAPIRRQLQTARSRTSRPWASWGLLPSAKAFVFVVNHDRERGHGGGGMLTFMSGAATIWPTPSRWPGLWLEAGDVGLSLREHGHL